MPTSHATLKKAEFMKTLASNERTHPVTRPLDGLLVLDFSQFLAGPSAALRLADLGADVIKIERPDGGDLCRQLYVSNLELDGDSTLFHTINRNKRSFAANLKSETDLQEVWALIARADVLVQNFRPGIMNRLGLGYEAVRKVNPRVVYGSVTGYGEQGPWRGKPGQDLLVQSLSGVCWLTGDARSGTGSVWHCDRRYPCRGASGAGIKRGERGEGGGTSGEGGAAKTRWEEGGKGGEREEKEEGERGRGEGERREGGGRGGGRG